ncbi:hypothetical protein [Rufibacter quisquiliarum]|nr:hypothetical protein [Rufibacter quisquiliarum]
MAEVVLEENRTTIENWNADQMEAGLRADGTRIEPDYTENTKRIKQVKGQPFDRVTLKDTGAFHNSIRMIAQDNEFLLKGDDPKTVALKMKYGDAILGLTEENTEDLKQAYLKEGLRERIKDHLKV